MLLVCLRRTALSLKTNKASMQYNLILKFVGVRGNWTVSADRDRGETDRRTDRRGAPIERDVLQKAWTERWQNLWDYLWGISEALSASTQLKAFSDRPCWLSGVILSFQQMFVEVCKIQPTSLFVKRFVTFRTSFEWFHSNCFRISESRVVADVYFFLLLTVSFPFKTLHAVRTIFC